ncbi:DNA recombination protein RecO [Sphingomonas changnyeongensis]|uniref:DNA recombination protein RecO n=1 Tax=Sphingomonas changnyeongensis TaxID=2698679 RepID=A0A7Z2S591_9SPHN|nr:recombination protein O N-terminal domain-containing protein [Sphingomonas changnyeongensis]QHL90840.1 DNA recombination protein RecO [Sphingomonas changnyeongensis]
MIIEAQALILAVRAHGEHGAVIRALTPAHGLQPGYVRGGRSRALRPVLSPGNVVALSLRARTETQLAAATAELVHSRAPLLAEPLPAAAIDWLCALTAATLPEGYAYPAVHDALAAVLDAVEHAPSARGWAPAIWRFEALLLAELGYGLAGGLPERRAAGPEAGGGGDATGDATGDAIARHLLPGRRGVILAARDRLRTRLARAGSGG